MARNKEILESALKYAARGWAVFPVSKDKNPLVKNGFKDATTDAQTIREWFTHYTGANIGIATGQVSGGLVVIDVDIDEDNGKFGNESLEDYCDQNGLFFSDTLSATTGRGGKHYYFHSSEPFGCKVGALKDVDIRGDGGYVIAPPSIHKNGMPYKWDDEDEEIVSVQEDSDVEFFLHEMFKKYSHEEKEKFEIPSEVVSGSRNESLFKFAASQQAKGLDDETIRCLIIGYNQKNCKPPLEDEEVNKILDSVLKRYEKGKKSVESTQAPPPKLEETKPKQLRKLKKANALMSKEIPEPIVYVGVGREDPILVEGTCILSAKPKLGKSWFVLDMCLSICRGESFLGYETKKSSCLYLDLETSESIQKKRLVKAAKERDVPDNFYLDTETENLDSGFIKQIEYYLEQDPNIGVVVVDVFQIIRSKQDAKNKENEYQHAYRDITPLNNLAMEKHISIILVCHDRKMVDENDPFANILGSTGLQGAVSQMIVMFQVKKDHPITIAVKGKTIDAQPTFFAKLEEGQWFQTTLDTAAAESEKMYEDYIHSDIRTAIVMVAEQEGGFEGKCSDIIDSAADLGYALPVSAMSVGHFLKKFRAFLLKYDLVEVKTSGDGNAGKKYKLYKKPLESIETIAQTIGQDLAKQGFTRV